MVASRRWTSARKRRDRSPPRRTNSIFFSFAPVPRKNQNAGGTPECPDIAVYARHQAGPGGDVLAVSLPNRKNHNPLKSARPNFRIVNRSFTPGVEMLALQKEAEK